MSILSTVKKMRIKVIRYKGDKPKSGIIISSLMGNNITVALQRGRVEIDLGENYSPVFQKTVFSPNATVGQNEFYI